MSINNIIKKACYLLELLLSLAELGEVERGDLLGVLDLPLVRPGLVLHNTVRESVKKLDFLGEMSPIRGKGLTRGPFFELGLSTTVVVINYTISSTF